MSLLDRLSQAWNAFTKSPPPTNYGAGWGGGSWFSDAFKFRRAPSPVELVDSYKSLVYACVNLNANAVARTPLRLYVTTKRGQAKPKCATKALGHSRRETQKHLTRLRSLPYAAKALASADEVEEVTSHPLLDTILHVNEELDHGQLLAYTVMSLEIVGAAYWWPYVGGYGVPSEMWALPPHLVYPMFTSGSMVPDKYQFGGIMYDRQDLIRFRRLSAKNPYGQGYGPEQASIEYARLEDTFVSIQDDMLSNGPRPSLIVSHRDPKGVFGEAERERIKYELNREARGGRAGEVVVVDGAASIEPVSWQPSDLGGLQISQYDLERIANCFDIPVSMLKTEDVNRANAEAGLIQHGRNAVEPRCKLIASTLTRWTHAFGAKKGWDRLLWAFDPCVPEDRVAESTLHKTYVDLGVIDRDEVRLELGYEPRGDGADQLLVSNSLVPIGMVGQEPREDAGGEDDAENAEAKALDAYAHRLMREIERERRA